MAKPVHENKIDNVKFTYSGTEENLNQFLATVIKDYMIKNKLIDDRLLPKVKTEKV